MRHVVRWLDVDPGMFLLLVIAFVLAGQIGEEGIESLGWLGPEIFVPLLGVVVLTGTGVTAGVFAPTRPRVFHRVQVGAGIVLTGCGVSVLTTALQWFFLPEDYWFRIALYSLPVLCGIGFVISGFVGLILSIRRTPEAPHAFSAASR